MDNIYLYNYLDLLLPYHVHLLFELQVLRHSAVRSKQPPTLQVQQLQETYPLSTLTHHLSTSTSASFDQVYNTPVPNRVLASDRPVTREEVEIIVDGGII